MDVFWDVAPCSLVEIDRCFGGAYCFHHQGVVYSSSVNIYQTIRRNIPQDSHLQDLTLTHRQMLSKMVRKYKGNRPDNNTV
jgi:hypothetical protein